MMKNFKTLKATVCLAALFSASSATADVTAAQVWDDWQANLAIYGENGVTIGSVEDANGTVTVTDLQLSMTDETDTTVTAEMGQIVFSEQGDGSVSVQMPDSYPITITFAPDDFVLIEVSQNAMRMIVSGEPDNMNYDVSANRYAFTVQDIVEAGESVLDGDLLMAANDMKGIYTIQTDTMRTIAYDISVASLDMLADVKDPDGTEENALISGKIEGLTMTADVAFPLDMDALNAENAFVDGLTAAGGYNISAMNFFYDMNVEDLVANGVVSIADTSLTVEIDKSDLVYDVQTGPVLIDANSPDIPFPVKYSSASSGMGIAMPVGISEDPQDFAFSMNLIDLTMNDEIWDMGDPGRILPRDPLSFNLDLTGQGRWFFDLLDPEQANAMNSAPVPGELAALNLNDLLISGAGAVVKGAGAFTFDNNDLETFDGMPRPLGDLKINISGANALVDNLVAMGLLPEDQASMARLSMGMFARNVGEDQLETTVEVNAEGHLIVNGQRMQ